METKKKYQEEKIGKHEREIHRRANPHDEET